jgi:hypothetical protein
MPGFYCRKLVSLKIIENLITAPSSAVAEAMAGQAVAALLGLCITLKLARFCRKLAENFKGRFCKFLWDKEKNFLFFSKRASFCLRVWLTLLRTRLRRAGEEDKNSQ